MTKKDFELIAQVLKESKPGFPNEECYDSTIVCWLETISRFTARLASDNELFDPIKFKKSSWILWRSLNGRVDW